MSLPTPVGTWGVTPNIPLTSDGPLPGDYVLRVRDVAQMFGIIVDTLLSSSGGLVTHAGSSDGTATSALTGTPFTPSGGANLWTQSNTTLRTSFRSYMDSAPAIAPWVVLNFPDGQLMMGIEGTGYGAVFRVVWSPGGLFQNPVSTYALPAASDQKLLHSSGFGFYFNYGIFNQDNLGIINNGQSYSNYSHKVQVGITADAKSFYVLGFRDNAPSFYMFLGNLTTSAALAAASDWDIAKVFFLGVSPTISQLVQRNYYNSGWIPTSSLDTAVCAVLPTIGFATGYGGFRSIQFSNLPDTDSGLYDMYPLGLYSYTYNGFKGQINDLWWGQIGGSLSEYPSAGPLQFVQVGDVVFPWAGAIAPQYA